MTSVIGLPLCSALAIAASRPAIDFRGVKNSCCIRLRQKNHGAAVCQDVVTGNDGQIANGHWDVGADLDNTVTRRARGGRAPEHRKIHLTRFIDIPHRAIDDDAGDATQLGAQRRMPPQEPASMPDFCSTTMISPGLQASIAVVPR